MKLNFNKQVRSRQVVGENARTCRSARGIALVITLLMLSAITFLAIAFLSMARRDRAAVTVNLDADASRNMSDAALNRAQAEIIAQMLARGDALSYDYMVSRNYIYPGGFNKNSKDITNVNYDIYTGSGFFNPPFNMSLNQTAWAQNIANLYYDPRPPVFVVTNPAYPNNSDFRFWVDINRNGRFETNGYLPFVLDNGKTNGNWGYFNGEPEWIGVLRDPLNRHSATNTFVGRYAYMVLPIGKTLDFNYIHNWAKGNYVDAAVFTNTSGPVNFYGSGNSYDGFARDQGIASYELNLAALLDVVSPNAYENGFLTIPGYTPVRYQYNPPLLSDPMPNVGSSFDDAAAFVHYRYWIWPRTANSQYFGFGNLRSLFPSLFDTRGSGTNFNTYGIDAYCLTAQTEPPFDPTNVINTYLPKNAQLWPGSYSSNMFYDLQDLFDPNKTSDAFSNRMVLAGTRENSVDRYTFQRLLNNISMGSSPEYSVWVYGDNGQPTLRTKININFDNTAQIQSGPYSPMPTNLVNWTPLGFFTNAAELLLRSQSFTFTNYVLGANGYQPQNTFTTNFGVTNIPVFRVYNPGIQYNEAIHRMLQMAANIYSATSPSNFLPGQLQPQLRAPAGGLPPVRHPFVFRPLFQIVNPKTADWGVDIVGFTNVSPADAYNQLIGMSPVWVDLTSNNVVNGYLNDFAKSGRRLNVSGIPWVVSAEKGLPQFYQYGYNSRILLTRKLLFSRYLNGVVPDTNRPPQYTNQFYIMSVSNSFGMDAWNPYTIPFAGSVLANGTTYYLSNYITVELTNNFNFGYTNAFSYTSFPGQPFQWRAWDKRTGSSDSNGFVMLHSTNFITVPSCYYSESQHRLIFFTNNIISSNSFLPQDLTQTHWPVHSWSLNITNHVVYALFDGQAQNGNAALLDFVNMGPFGNSVSITDVARDEDKTGPVGAPAFASNPWDFRPGTDLPNSPMYNGLQYQINSGISEDPIYTADLLGTIGAKKDGGAVFGADYNPSNVFNQVDTWVANDPLVHYTIGDLIWPGYSDLPTQAPINGLFLLTPVTNSVGGVSARYNPWPSPERTGGVPGADMLFKDPMITSASAWQFPTNKFPSVGWLGRVHRGTPWQTVYLKSDNPTGESYPNAQWANWSFSAWNPVTQQPDTYPTNDWVLPDLFTTALNDNSMRGLLSVNQTNYGAWAAVLGGVIAMSNVNVGAAIEPSDVYQFVDGNRPLNNPINGINYIRSTNLNGLFHSVGEILKVPALTTQSPYWTNSPLTEVSDEVVERIPQQILGLLKVGEPQFVIYAWGQSLRPKNLYLSSPNNNLCTNYEITGEFLSRTVCHVVHTNVTPKMVIDSYNIEPAD